MSRSPRVQGALAAATAAFCVLGLAVPALASGGGTGDLLPGPGRCALAAEQGEGFAAGPKPPGAGREAGARAMPLACAASRAAGLRLVQSETGPAATPPEENGQEGEGEGEGDGERDGEPAQGLADAAEAEPATTDEPAFEGSAQPASPDLTPSEERALISRGWE